MEQETDPRWKEFRAAVHTVLYAIANDPVLQPSMIIKGGILLSFRYRGYRHTQDMDFSTAKKYSVFDPKSFRAILISALAMAVESLHYDVDCRIQSLRVNPKNEKATFPTLAVSVGYAPKGVRGKYNRLLSGNSSDRVKIDYSFNEVIYEIERLRLSGGGEIIAYSLTDLIAEKYRSILQQEVRNRFRRQDAYDLFCLFREHRLDMPEDKVKILTALLAKSASRGLKLDRYSMRQGEIERRSREDYHQLAHEIPGALPDFKHVYPTAREFYESLPWEWSLPTTIDS